MQKSHLYQATLLVNRGIDEALQGLDRPKRTRSSGFDPSCLDEKAALSTFSASLKSATTSHEAKSAMWFDSKAKNVSTRKTLEEVQVCRDVLAVEERRRAEGKPPKVRSLTSAEQQEWERQYPKPPENPGNESLEIGTEQL